MLMDGAQMIALVNGPCFSPHSLIEVDINVVRHSARLPTNILLPIPTMLQVL